MIRDAMRISREINNTPIEAITPEQLYECVGIEVFVTQGLAVYVAEKKRAHVDDVLSEQTLQEYNGICDIEKLSSVSKNGSRWHRSRAQKLASAYNGLLDQEKLLWFSEQRWRATQGFKFQVMMSSMLYQNIVKN